MKAWNQRKEESTQAYAGFCLYLKTPSTQRTLDKAYQRHFEQKHGHPVGKLKKASGRWRKWSTDHKWTDRAQAYDAEQQRKSLIRTANRRQNDIEQFVDADMMLSLGFQRIASRKVAVMMKQDPVEVDSSELRQIALAYDTARSWLTELIGLFDSEVQPLSELAQTDEALAQQLQEEIP